MATSSAMVGAKRDGRPSLFPPVLRCALPHLVPCSACKEFVSLTASGQPSETHASRGHTAHPGAIGQSSGAAENVTPTASKASMIWSILDTTSPSCRRDFVGHRIELRIVKSSVVLHLRGHASLRSPSPRWRMAPPISPSPSGSACRLDAGSVKILRSRPLGSRSAAREFRSCRWRGQPLGHSIYDCGRCRRFGAHTHHVGHSVAQRSVDMDPSLDSSRSICWLACLISGLSGATIFE